MRNIFAVILVVYLFAFCVYSDLKQPSSLAINSSGVLLVLSGIDIQEYVNGHYNRTINERTNYIGAVDDTNEIVIGKGISEKINKSDIERYAKYYRVAPVLEQIIQKFIYPMHIAVGPNGNLYVVGEDIFRKNFKLGILDPVDGHPIEVFFTVDRQLTNNNKERRKGELVYPNGLAVDSDGNFYITDAGKVKIFNRKGEDIRSFGEYGSGDGQFKGLRGIALDEQNGYIYTTEDFATPSERPQMRVQKFTKDGKFVLKWGDRKFKGIEFRWWIPNLVYEYELFNLVDIAIDSKGDVFVLRSNPAEVRKYTPEGKLIMKWGKWGKGLGEFMWPQAIAIDKDDNVYVADTDNNRIQKFDANGKFLMEIK